jgi:hypothetical protein
MVSANYFNSSIISVGKTLSKEERDRRNLTGEKSLIYGEVEFNSFYRVLRKLNPAPGLVENNVQFLIL